MSDMPPRNQRIPQEIPRLPAERQSPLMEGQQAPPWRQRPPEGRGPSDAPGNWHGAVALVGLAVLLGVVSTLLPFVKPPGTIRNAGDEIGTLEQIRETFRQWIPGAFAISLILLALSGLGLVTPWLHRRLRPYLSSAFAATVIFAAVNSILTAVRVFSTIRASRSDGENVGELKLGFWLFLLSSALLAVGGMWATASAYAQWRQDRFERPAYATGPTPGWRRAILTCFAIAATLGVAACATPYVAYRTGEKGSKAFFLLQWELPSFIRTVLVIVLAVLGLLFLRIRPGARPGPFFAWGSVAPLLTGIVLFATWMAHRACLPDLRRHDDYSDSAVSGGVGLWLCGFSALFFVLGGAVAMACSLPRPVFPSASPIAESAPPARGKGIQGAAVLRLLTAAILALGILALVLPYVGDREGGGKRSLPLLTSSISVAILLTGLFFSATSLTAVSSRLGRARPGPLVALASVPLAYGTVIAIDFFRDFEQPGGAVLLSSFTARRGPGTWCYIACSLLLVFAGILAAFLAVRTAADRGSADAARGGAAPAASREPESPTAGGGASRAASPLLPPRMHPAVACLAGAGSLLVIVSVFVPVTFINHDDGDGYKYIPFKTDPYFLLMISIFCYFSLVYLTRAIRKGEEDPTLLAEFAFLASGIVMIGRLADLWQGVIRLRSNDGGRLDAGFSVGFWLIGVGGLLFLAAGIAGVLLAARRARFFAVIAWPSPLSARRRIALGALSGLGSALTIASAFPLFTTSPQYSGLESASILTRYVGILLTSLALAVLSCVFLALAAGRATWLRRRMLAAFAVLPLSFGAFAEVTGLEQWIIVRYWRSADSALSGSRTGPGFWLFVGAGLAFLLAGAFAARFIRDIDGRRFPPEIPVPQAHTPPPYGQPAQPLGGDPWNHPQPAGNPRPFPAYSQRFPGPPQSQGDPAPRQAPSHPTRDGQPAPVPSPPPRPRAEPTGPAPRDDASGPDAPGDTSRFAPPPKDPDGQP